MPCNLVLLCCLFTRNINKLLTNSGDIASGTVRIVISLLLPSSFDSQLTYISRNHTALFGKKPDIVGTLTNLQKIFAKADAPLCLVAVSIHWEVTTSILVSVHRFAFGIPVIENSFIFSNLLVFSVT